MPHSSQSGLSGRLTFSVVVALAALTFLPAAFGRITVRGEDGENYKGAGDFSPKCKALTDRCSVCSDGKLRRPARGKVPGTELALTAYECATKGKQVFRVKGIDKAVVFHFGTNQHCKVMSDFCAVCADGTYVFTGEKIKIQSDLYECATAPRVKLGGL
ncbi:MAG: hypothetical protein HY074_06890 [Deltaproteobacteria bacterium]|nr:hypothetical protein [Deltaproteobacteria bacterium]